MKKLTGFLLLSSALLWGLGTMAAQEKAEGVIKPPKMLVITREFLKPGKMGVTHEKTESAFVQALRGAKWPTHYLAVDSLSGKPRSLFLTGYDSFEAWEKDYQSTQKNAALATALDHAGVVDGELQSDADGGAFAYRDEYSLRPGSDIPHMRYFEISVFHVRPGHDKDWDSLVKMVMAAYEKIPDVHWATYQTVFGSQGDTFVVFVPRKSLKEIDEAFAKGKQFETAMGEDGMKKLDELSAVTIESSQNNLFIFNPRMSYVSDEWVNADPDFWKPKAASAPKKAEKMEKPAVNQ